MNFVPTTVKKKTVASVTAALQKTINDLLYVETQAACNAENMRAEANRLTEQAELEAAEADKAAKVRVKLEGLLN